jgi:hypothetical protein
MARMKLHDLSDDRVLLVLTIDEHAATSRAMGAVMETLDIDEIEDVLRADAEAAYEFQFSVARSEVSARPAGNQRLPPSECCDVEAAGMRVTAAIAIHFDSEGSLRRLSRDQLRMVQTILAFHTVPSNAPAWQ